MLATLENNFPLWKDSLLSQGQNTVSLQPGPNVLVFTFGVKSWAEAETHTVTRVALPNAQTSEMSSYPGISDSWSHSRPEARRAENPNSWSFSKHIFAYTVLGSSSWVDWLNRGQRKLTTAISVLTFATTIKC